MAENKKSFMAYCDWIGTFEELPDDKAGQLAKHLFRYVNDLDPKTDDILINAVFANIKQSLKRDLKKYKETCNKNRENVLLRWNKKDTTVCDRIPTDTKHTDSDNDNDKEDKSIVKYLNDKTSKQFKFSSTKTKTLIKSRKNEGFSFDDFKTVIDNKVKDWLKDDKMNEYLRPETLFGTKFESYLNRKTDNKQPDRLSSLQLAAEKTKKKLNER